nr:T9SS type A sorting domain-containing protein [Bacteroidota bacterium]
MRYFKLIIVALTLYTSAASAQWSIDSLSTPYNGLTVTQNGSKAIFANATKYELYDFTNNAWTTYNMAVPRSNVKAATANGKSYFGGGGFIGLYSYNFFNNVEIYNASGSTWTTAKLSTARIVGNAVAIGNKVMFAGGRQILNYSNRVDIFDVTTGVRTTHNLSRPRTNMAVAVVGTKIIFAGGETGNIPNGVYTSSNKVDIYDDATGIWSTALISVKREQIAVAVAGNKVLFAGGITPSGLYSNRIDIYDAAANTWSTKNMSQTKYGIATATAGDKIYLAGGTINNSGALSNRVEIYNATTNTLSYVTLSSPRMSMAVAQTAKRIMFAGGVVTWGNVGTDRIEVLDLATNVWSVEYLSRPRLNLASASYGNKAMFAGGAEVLSGYPQYTILSKRVDIWTDLQPRFLSHAASTPSNESSITVYPNPAIGNFINVELKQFEDDEVYIQITNMNGDILQNQTINNFSKSLTQIDIANINAGLYQVTAISKSKKVSSSFVVQH